MKRFKSKLVKVENLTESVRCFKFALVDSNENFDFKPGQFVTATFLTDEGKTKRSYSIASIPSFSGGRKFDLCIKEIPGGKGTKFFWSLKEGDDVEFIGPLGGFTVKNQDKDLVFIATGTGIAPFVPMISDLLEKGFLNKIILLKGFRNEKGILYDKEFKALSEKYDNFEFYNVLSRPEKEYKDKGYVQDFVEKYLPWDFKGDFYICGLGKMVEDVKKKLVSLGFKEEQVFVEKY